MKKFYLATFTVIATVILAACGGDKQTDWKKDKEIIVVVQLESSKDILEIAKREAEKRGHGVNTMEMSDNVVYSDTVQHDEMDANFAQHGPFIEMFNRKKKVDLVVTQPIHYLAGGFYSKEYQDAKGLPENAKVGAPSDLTNEGCTLAILDANGVIKLKKGVGFNGMATDVVKNPKDITFESIDLLNLAKTYDEKDIATIFCYPVYLEPAGLTTRGATLLEDGEAGKHYILQVVTRKDEKDSEKVKVLKEVMTTKEVVGYAKKNSKGVNTPAF